MKRLVLTLVILATFTLGGVAQNVWKPIDMNGEFLGVSADGSVFSNWGYSGLHRSQDEGATWELNYDLSYVNSKHFIINDNDRIFIFNQNDYRLYYSDDNGDTWQEQASGISTNWVEGMYSLSNDTIVMVNNEKFFWTLDGGESWNETNISFLQDMVFTSILADHEGNVYISITNAVPTYELGIYTANFNDIENWTCLLAGAMIYHMELDPEGNVVAGGYGHYQQQQGLYLVPDRRFTIADNGIVYDLHDMGDDYNDYTVLRYSADHGENFYENGEALPLYSPSPGGLGDGSIYKGRDGHLYFGGHGARMKSVFNTNDIHYIEGEVVVLQDAFAFGNYPHGAGQAIRVDDNHIYPVTVDGFRPNPTDLSRLIVRYDTIPMGATIGAFGTIKEMHDYVGHSQNVLDIQQTTAHYYDAITATLEASYEDNKVIITTKNPPYQTYYITINGEQQEFPLTFNGMTLYAGCLPCTFIGHCGIQMNQYAVPYYGMELAVIQPFMDYNYQIDGTLTTDFWDPPCLSCPCEEDENQHFLTVLPSSLVVPHYLMRNGQLYKNTFINNDIFREGMQVDIKGIRHFRYDMPGDEVNVVELVEMDTDEETTLTGTVDWAPMPHTGYIPLPGMEIVFNSNGRRYYLENEQDIDGGQWFLVGNDTVYVNGQEITATFTTKMMLTFDQNFYYRINITEAVVLNEIFPLGSEWYYEIQNENGSITYQHLYQSGDTIVNDEPTQILVKINTLYDKGLRDEVTHEYIQERDGKVYWWNKTLGEFTVLYDFNAEVGDEWEIKVGTESIVMHVDAVEDFEYEGKTYRMLRVSDADDIFSGDIVCGIGHLTSFFPERLMDNRDGILVEGLRCYWVEDELVFKPGDEDCDAIYEELHGIEEGGPSTPSTGSGTAGTFTVYPNPANGVLFVETVCTPSLPDQTYRITNLMGQTVLSGNINAETQQIDVSSLPQGMYFITFAGETRKFVVR